MSFLFELKDGACGYSKKIVLKNVNFSLNSGEVLCVLGANGAGKSTLFKSILGLLPMKDGALNVNGESIESWSRARIAQTVGYVPQVSSPPFSYTAMDVVLMGRTAYLKPYQSPRKEDEEIAAKMIDKLKINQLTNRFFLELSGGEQQLVLIARALTQLPKVLIMDEPTTGLDFGNQQLVLEQVYQLAKDGLAVIMSSHFPDHAFLYANKVLMLKNGGVHASGTPKDVVTEQNLFDLYSVKTKIVNTGIYSESAAAEILTCIPLS